MCTRVHHTVATCFGSRRHQTHQNSLLPAPRPNVRMSPSPVVNLGAVPAALAVTFSAFAALASLITTSCQNIVMLISPADSTPLTFPPTLVLCLLPWL